LIREKKIYFTIIITSPELFAPYFAFFNYNNSVNRMDANRGLLFIPDISGFTKFINETEINHSRMIMQELLELLINSNQIGLEISEIEGDAILFYKFGDVPNLEELYGQVEKMFCEFTRRLLVYDQHRYCQCSACVSAVGLTLKIITHYGEFTSYKVKDFTKLIGRDVIVAHQLLKNEIEQHEYWLVTKNLQDNPPGSLTNSMKWNLSIKKTESGEVPFHYTQLGYLKDTVTSIPFPPPDLSHKTAVFSLSGEYEAGIITLFHAVGDFHYRDRWMDGVLSVEDADHNLPRVGMKCKCITNNGAYVIYSGSYSFTDENIQFSETNEKDESTVCYLLEKISKGKTRLTITYYLKNSFVNLPLFRVIKKSSLESSYKKSMQNLTGLVKEIFIPGLPDI
jgi:hypothetical protein